MTVGELTKILMAVSPEVATNNQVKDIAEVLTISWNRVVYIVI